MEDVIKKLQLQVYKLDWRIAQAGQDLINNVNVDSNQKYYNDTVEKRAKLLECIEILKNL